MYRVWKPFGSEYLEHPQRTTPAEWGTDHTWETRWTSSGAAWGWILLLNTPSAQCREAASLPRTKICGPTLPKAASRCGPEPPSVPGERAEDGYYRVCEARPPFDTYGADGKSDWLLSSWDIYSPRWSAADRPILQELLWVDEMGPTYVSEVWHWPHAMNDVCFDPNASHKQPYP